jgi:hypothetical protein
VLLGDELVDVGDESTRDDVVAALLQRERQQLRDLRRVVDQYNARQNQAFG